MTETTLKQSLEALQASLDAKDPLIKSRQKAWERYTVLGLPTRKSELFKYVKLRKLLEGSYLQPEISEKNYQEHILPECEKSVLIFVNGAFCPHISNTSDIPQKVALKSLSEASRTFGTFLNNQWNQSLREENDPFAACNGALHTEGLFIYIPPGTIIEQPIQILHIIDTHVAEALIMPRVHLFAGANSEVQLFETTIAQSREKYAVNGVLEFSLDDNASVQITQTDAPGNNCWNLEALRATLKRNSRLKVLTISNGSTTTRKDFKVSLNGENSEAELKGIYILDGSNEGHTNVLIEHRAPQCRSYQHYKTVLSDSSRSSFEGKIYVHQAGQKTEAYQLNNNLILDDAASANSKPNLEIFADDVKASHGSTIGQLDEEQVHYLKTRGLNDKQARSLLIEAFYKEILDQISLPSLAKRLYQHAQNRY